MIKQKEELTKSLIDICVQNLTNKNWLQAKTKVLVEEYEFRTMYAMDVLRLRHDMNEESEFVLFALCSTLGVDVTKYFTLEEIKTYKSANFNESSFGNQIRVPATKITENQFFVATDAKWFLTLVRDQLIRYNPNTQRPMTVVKNGSVEYFIATVNKKRVKEIAHHLLNGTFFPTPVTLNILQYGDSDMSYHYDEKTNELVVDDLDFFDIIDGQHRNVALAQCCQEHPDFNCIFPVMITAFSEAQARSYIYQMGQQEPFVKAEIDTYNPENTTTKIVNFIKANPIYADLLNGNEIINERILHYFISRYFVRHASATKVANRSEIKSISNDVVGLLDKIEKNCDGIYDSKIDDRRLMALLVCASYDKIDRVDSVLEWMMDSNNKFQLHNINNGSWARLTRYAKEV